MMIDGSTSGDTVSVRFFEEADMQLDEFGEMQPTKFNELSFSLLEANALSDWLSQHPGVWFRGHTVRAVGTKDSLTIEELATGKLFQFDGKELVQQFKTTLGVNSFRLGRGVDPSSI